MKIINTLIYIIGLQSITFAAPSATVTPRANAEKSSVSFYISSPLSETLRAKYTPSSEAKDVVITSVPAADKALSSVNIELDMLGVFTFKKDAALQIPSSCEVFIEDKLNGKIFNLRSQAAYTFKVDSHISGRFVMHILDRSEPENLASK